MNAMIYNRPYELADVARILDASEHRPRPDILSGTGPKGHAISLHTLERKNLFARDKQRDSLFLVSRSDLAEIVHEALNSASGQRELEKLNQPNRKAVVIRTVIIRQGSNFDILTLYRPKTDEQVSFDWLSTTKGDGYIVQLFVTVYKIPNSANDIHIQTVYPDHFARISGGEIVGCR